MLNIELNQAEYNYLFKVVFVEDKYRKMLHFMKQNDDKYLIKVSEGQADDIRDLCGEQLQIVGFDEGYELTNEGKILETLIDKFFVG
jgi:hypothetical protein